MENLLRWYPLDRQLYSQKHAFVQNRYYFQKPNLFSIYKYNGVYHFITFNWGNKFIEKWTFEV